MSSNSNTDSNAAHSSLEEDPSLKLALDALKKSKRLVEMKLQISRKIHREELKLIDNTKLDDLLRNHRDKDYIQDLKNRLKLKNDDIQDLKNEVDRLRKEVETLNEKRCQLTKQSNHHFQLYREAKDKLDRMSIVQSPTSSFEDGHVPPPPAIEVPSIEEIFENAKTPPPLMSMQPHHDSLNISSGNNSQYSMMNSSIPPPPMVDVNFDDIFNQTHRYQ